MKKVCFFMNTPFSLGGEQRVVSKLSNYLVENNYEVSFLLTDVNKEINYDFYKLNKKIKVIFMDNYNRLLNRLLRKILKIIRYSKHTNLFIQKQNYCNILDKTVLTKYINENKFDYIIGIGSDYFGTLSVLKGEISSKIIAWEHSTFEAYFETKNRRFYNQKKFVDFMFSNIDEYICQTNNDYIQIYNKYKYRCKVIGNPNTFTVKKEALLNKPFFLAVGRLEKVKGYDLLIKAFSIFSKKNDLWSLYIVGDGKEKDNYLQLIKSNKLEDRIFLVGKTNNVEKYYLDSSILMITSLWEGWGMVATEGMQYGLPVISFDLPSIKEIFGDKECGILIEKGNIKQLANAMLELVENKTMINRYSNNSKEAVKCFDIEIIGKEWKKILK